MTELQRVSFRKPITPEPRLSPPRKLIPGRIDKRFWTPAEDAIIRQYYSTGGYAACAARLPQHHTSKGAIYQRANNLGLSASKRRGGGPKKKIKVPDNIDDTLRREYELQDGKKRGAINAIADKLKLPRWWVTKRATKLGLSMPHKKEPPWTAAEDVLLLKVPLHNPDRCALIFRQHGFKRTPTAISIRAKRKSLSRRYTATLAATTVGKILGVDSKTVTREILLGSLKAVKRETKRRAQQGGDPWSISRDELRRYIITNLERIDFRKVDKFEFVQVLIGKPMD